MPSEYISGFKINIGGEGEYARACVGTANQLDAQHATHPLVDMKPVVRVHVPAQNFANDKRTRSIGDSKDLIDADHPRLDGPKRR